MILPCLIIAPTAQMGRGVFTLEALAADTLVEISPVIVLPEKDRKLLDQTLLHYYIFEWGEDQRGCCVALVMYPYTTTVSKAIANTKWMWNHK
jgi:hypothetical protein